MAALGGMYSGQKLLTGCHSGASLISQILAGLFEGVGRSDQALEGALKVLRQIAPVLRADPHGCPDIPSSISSD